MSTLKRALAILDLFSLATPVLTAEEIISKLSYSAPTGYRYIRDLSDLGYLLRMTGGGYKLGPRIIELDHLIIDGDPVLGVARPIMREVVDQVGGDVLLSVIHGLRILNIHHERGPDALGIPHGRGRARCGTTPKPRNSWTPPRSTPTTPSARPPSTSCTSFSWPTSPASRSTTAWTSAPSARTSRATPPGP